MIHEVSLGLESKTNTIIFWEYLVVFIKMRQGVNDYNSNYLEWFKSYLQTLILAVSGHIICSDDTVEKLPSTATNDIIEAEENKFKAIWFIMHSDSGRYSELLKVIKESTYLGRDEYPTTLTSTYEMLVCHYVNMSNDRGRHAQINYNHGSRCYLMEFSYVCIGQK